ncbi:uncharacterized protein CTRU02_215751 [Colletotrichum truncatum]|uniref:Uncharacterized protein n=1 Tax=Colletotrichum truncatum TaxID=5467 RepID=A0ACC3YBT5_COLTU|nr:uncharacterized protein CTRU02_15213 [Colletotrichum truncatum]KAF6781323.1 hypothetical protein CTRU02_15213 [Colletotrichum truncatum]
MSTALEAPNSPEPNEAKTLAVVLQVVHRAHLNCLHLGDEGEDTFDIDAPIAWTFEGIEGLTRVGGSAMPVSLKVADADKVCASLRGLIQTLRANKAAKPAERQIRLYRALQTVSDMDGILRQLRAMQKTMRD